jgi:formylglycine-generating enzyme required for sulfatase activity
MEMDGNEKNSITHSPFLHKKVLIAALSAALLLLIQPPLTHVGVLSFAQSGSGEREPPKPRSTPRPSTRTSTSSGTPRRTTPPARSRQAQCVSRSPTSGTGREYSENLNGVRLEMVEMPAGNFCMGSPNGVGETDEHPQHQVSVPQFYMGKYEVTQAQYRAVMGTNPAHFTGCDECPIEDVSWNDAQEFIRKLNGMQSRYRYRLPSEAEWEYACRAGTTTAFAFGDSLSSNQANSDGNYPFGGAAKGVYRQKTTSVGSFQPNAWGLYDMHGNVLEWCEDWYHDNYNGAPSDGSAWESGGGQGRVLRGGSWGSPTSFLRSAHRYRRGPGNRSDDVGFRVVAVSRSS